MQQRERNIQQFLNYKKLMKSRHFVLFCALVYEHWERLQMLVKIIMKSVELNLDQSYAYSVNFESNFSQKRSLVRKNCILYFVFSFSRRIVTFPLVPPITRHPVYTHSEGFSRIT